MKVQAIQLVIPPFSQKLASASFFILKLKINLCDIILEIKKFDKIIVIWYNKCIKGGICEMQV